MNTKTKYALYGIAFGAFFPIGAAIFELILNDLALSVSNIHVIHTNNPLLFIIDSAPIWLGLFAFFGGVQQAKSQKLLEQFIYVSSILKNSSSQLNSNSKSVFSEMKKKIYYLNCYSKEMKKANTEINSVINQSNQNVNNMSGVANQVISSTRDLISINAKTLQENSLIADNILKFMQTFNHSVSEIEKIKLIGKQINILSINSSVEANKLGAQGKGFAAIARNIKDLAEKTFIINESIEKNIKDSIREAEEIKAMVQNEQKHLDSIKSLSASLEEKMTSFRQTLDNVIEHINDVCNRNENQNNKFNELNKSADYIEHVYKDMTETLTKTINKELEVVLRINTLTKN